MCGEFVRRANVNYNALRNLVARTVNLGKSNRQQDQWLVTKFYF